MSLYEEIVLKNNKTKKYSQFFGDYSTLNDIDTLANTNLFKIQQLALYSMINANNNFKLFNEFWNEVSGTNTDVQKELADTAIKRIVNILNVVFTDGKKLPFQIQQGQDIYKELLQQLQLLNISQSVDPNLLNRINETLGKIVKKDNTIDFENLKKQYIADKAQLLEQVIILFFTQNSEKIEGFSSGQIYDSVGQLVQDGFILPSGNLKNIKVQKMAKQNQSTNKVIQNLLNGQKINITGEVPDYFSAVIQSLGALRIQAKSGKKQALFSGAERNKVILRSITQDSDNIVRLKLFEEIKNSSNSFWWKNKENSPTSSTLQNYANYLLVKNIKKTVLGLNDLYVTEEGIHTAAEIYENRKHLIHFINKNHFRNIYRFVETANQPEPIA